MRAHIYGVICKLELIKKQFIEHSFFTYIIS